MQVYISYDLGEHNDESRRQVEELLARHRAVLVTKSTYRIECRDVFKLGDEIRKATRKGDTVALIHSKEGELIEEYAILSGETRKAVLPHRLKEIVLALQSDLKDDPVCMAKLNGFMNELDHIIADPK